MKIKKLGTFLTSLTLITAIIAPSFAYAQLPPGFPTKPTKPAVPINDEASNTKEVGITVFGVTIPGITLDGLAIRVAKSSLERIVDSTVDWINSGFDGNPVYITNPGEYFANIADEIAGEFIEDSPQLSGLCTPFQANIRLSLQTYYNNTYRRTSSPQCTLSDVVNNIEGFYDDFSQGGWEGWITLTQESGNNPYLAYLDAQTDLDYRIANALQLEEDDLNRGRGFLSLKDSDGNIKTPGSVIEGQLQTVLGTGVRELELADEFDELINALMGQLLQKTVFSSAGLGGGISNDDEEENGGGTGNNTGGNTGGGNTGGGTGTGQPTNPGVENVATCSATREFAGLGSPVTWFAQTTLLNPSYLWQGEEIEGGTQESISLTYSASGLKTAGVTITGIENGVERTVTVECDNSVTVIELGSGIIPL